MKRFVVLFVVVLSVALLSITAHATLIDNLDGTVTDTDTNLMWLQDANYAMTSGYDTNGLMDWSAAMTWANTLIFAGYDDWRLPSSLNLDGSGPCLNFNCTGSDMGHLYYTELGNPAGGPLTNTSPFINLQALDYWSGTESSNPNNAWLFNFNNGAQDYGSHNYYGKGDNLYAWAVRDAASVPEPTSLLLLGSGLVGLIGLKRKKH